MQHLLAVAGTGPQAIEMAVRDSRQALELGLAVDLEPALENGLGGRSGECLMSLVDGG